MITVVFFVPKVCANFTHLHMKHIDKMCLDIACRSDAALLGAVHPVMMRFVRKRLFESSTDSGQCDDLRQASDVARLKEKNNIKCINEVLHHHELPGQLQCSLA